VVPGPLARLYDLVVTQKNIDEGRALSLRYLPLVEFVGGQAYVAGTKALLAHMGFAAGMPRPPRLPLSAGQDAAARELVQRFELTFTSPTPSTSPR
jgi:4-hydroxy-tetrahydrodipicolinate synthase